MAWAPDQLKKVREDLDQGTKRSVSVRELLQWFGSYRRGRHVVSQVRQSLKALFVSRPIAWHTTNATASASVSRMARVVSFRRSVSCRISWASSRTRTRELLRLG